MSTTSIDNFLEMMIAERGASDNTRESYERDLIHFSDHLYTQQNKQKLSHATEVNIENYIADLFKQRFAHATIARRLSTLKQYYFFLVSEKERDDDPTMHINVKTKNHSLPKHLTQEEIALLMDTAASNHSVDGVRLYALLEILYASGLRVSELVKLKKSALQKTFSEEQQQMLLYLIVTGKGNKERIVPITPTAAFAINAHTNNMTEKEKESPFLFPSHSKEGHLTRQRFGQLLKKLTVETGLDAKRVSPHIIRHSFATHLLNNGMDLRTLQELLGHEDISTTQIYTHIADDSLQEMMYEKHPLAKKKVSEL